MPGNKPIFPIGVRCVQDALNKDAHETRLLDFVESPSAINDLSWVNQGWDIIGFAIRNIDPIDLSCGGHISEYEAFIRRVKQALSSEKKPVLVIGGPGYSLFAKSILERFDLDVGILGPGESAMQNIANDPEKFVRLKSVLVGQRYKSFGAQALKHPVKLMQAYASQEDAMIGVETMRRTCYQKCSYCPYAFIDGDNSGDFKPVAVIQDEIRHIYESGFRRIFFTDSIFNSQSAAKPIVRMLGESNFEELSWSAYFSPKPFSKEFAKSLAISGIETVVISPDSLDVDMMKRLGKNFSLDDVERFIERCRNEGLNPKVNIVFGGPGETRNTVANTARYANEKLKDGELSMHVGYRILPNTALAEQTNLTEEQMLEPSFYPIDDEIISWVVAELDSRFLTPSVMMNLMAGRAAVRRMTKITSITNNSNLNDNFGYSAISNLAL